MELTRMGNVINVSFGNNVITDRAISLNLFGYTKSSVGSISITEAGKGIGSSLYAALEINGVQATEDNVDDLMSDLTASSGSGGGITKAEVEALIDEALEGKYVPWSYDGTTKPDGQPRRHIVLGNYDALLGTDLEGSKHVLAMCSKWEDDAHPILDYGSSTCHVNHTSIDRPSTQVDGESGEEAEDNAFLSDLPASERLVFKIPDLFFNPVMTGDTGNIQGVTWAIVQQLNSLYNEGLNPVGSSSCLSFYVTRLQISNDIAFFEYTFTKIESNVLNVYTVGITGTEMNIVSRVARTLSYDPKTAETSSMFVGDLSNENTEISGVYDNFIITVSRQSNSVSLYLRRVLGSGSVDVYTGFTEGSTYTPKSTVSDSGNTNIGLLNISALTNYSMYITTDESFYELSIAALLDRTKVWCKIEKASL